MGSFWDNPWVRGAAAIGTGGGSELARGYFNAGDPYNQAAAGAFDISRQGKEFADQQWGRQMEGLQGALGSYAPSQAYWDNTYGSQGPGSMEQWWAQNGSKFGQEGAQQGAYNSFQNWMNQPGYGQLGYAQAGQSLAGSNNSASAYGAMGQGLQNYSGPQNGQQAFNYNQSSYQQPGQGENWYTQNANRYNQQTNADAAYGALAPQLAMATQAQDYARNMQGKLSDQQFADQMNLLAHQSWANSPTVLQQNEGENKGYVRNANDLTNYFQSQLGALSGPGQYEQLVSSQINGTDPLYERERQRTVDTINQEMIRRGGFNSGGAMTALGNAVGAFDAADYQNRANRAQQAQQMELSRIGQGLQGAQATAQGKIGQGQALAGMDTANESAQGNRQNFGLAAENQFNQAQAARDRLGLDAANSADQGQLARLMGQFQMSQGADASNLNLLNAGQNASSDAQNQMLARLMGYQNSANSIDQTRLASDAQGLARMMGSFNMAQGADQTAMQRAQQQYGMGMGMDQFNLAKYAQQQNAAQGLDQYNLASLLGGGQMAGAAQDAQQQRMAQAFGSLFGINNAEAGQYGTFYGNGGQLSGQAFSDAMNALANAYGLQAQGGAASSEYLMKLLGLGVQGAGAAAGGRPPGGAPGGGSASYQFVNSPIPPNPYG